MRARLAMAAAIAALGIGAAVALAANSSLTITAHGIEGPNGRFNGHLTSDVPSCAKGTLVKLRFDKPGKPKHFHVVGSDLTDKDGKWVVRFENAIPPGRYYASVKEDGVCPAVKTSVVKITAP